MNCKKICFFMLLIIILFVAFCCVFNLTSLLIDIIEAIQIITAPTEFMPGDISHAKNVISYSVAELFFPIISLTFCMIQLVFMIKKTNISNVVRLTYEQYKEKRLEKQAEKQKKKAEKLQRKLNELKKD